jgi:hypothetical protein
MPTSEVPPKGTNVFADYLRKRDQEQAEITPIAKQVMYVEQQAKRLRLLTSEILSTLRLSENQYLFEGAPRDWYRLVASWWKRYLSLKQMQIGQKEVEGAEFSKEEPTTLPTPEELRREFPTAEYAPDPECQICQGRGIVGARKAIVTRPDLEVVVEERPGYQPCICIFIGDRKIRQSVLKAMSALSADAIAELGV